MTSATRRSAAAGWLMRQSRRKPTSPASIRNHPSRSALRPPLHIGDADGHAELSTADVGQHGNALADLLFGGAGEAKPQPAARIWLVGRPFRPRIDRDAGGERRLIKFQRIDVVGQLDPEEDTT